jgi:branched-chain amino acid aminotransferase
MYYNENTMVYLNGEFLKAADAKCGIYSQSLHYGYAVFEGIRSYNTSRGAKIFKAKEHYERLLFSAKTLHIPVTYSVDELTALTYTLLEKNDIKDAYIRPLIFCHQPNMSLTAPKESALFLAAWEWGKYLGDKQVRLMVSSYQRPNPNAFHIEAKASGHYVNSTLATAEAKAQGYDEALLLDANGNVAEGPGANFFFEKNGKLYTPPRGNILPGITRNTIIDLARKTGIEVEEKYFTIEDIKAADGAFFTGTAAEVTGIESINEVKFNLPFDKTIGAKIAKKYQDLVHERKEEAALK